MPNVSRITCAALLFLIGSSLQAQSGSWRVIGSANWLERTGEATAPDEPPAVGTARLETDFDSGAGIGLAFAYYLTDNLAIEARGSVVRSDLRVRIRTASDAVAVLDLGNFHLYPLGAVLQYHIPTTRRFRPFVGAGAGYLIVGDVEGEGSERVEFDNSTGLILNAGFNYSFGNHWALNGDVRYAPIETESTAIFVERNQVEELNIEPLIISAGLSYSF